MEELIADLVARLKAIRFLARPTIEWIEEVFRTECSPEDLHLYAQETMPILDRLQERLDAEPPMRAFGDRMAGIADRTALAAEFGMESFGFLDWVAAQSRDAEDVRKAYCGINLTAALVVSVARRDASPAARAGHVLWKSNFLRRVLSDRQGAGRFLEDWFQLWPECYEQPGLRARLERALEGVGVDTSLRLIDGLSDGLWALERDDHLRALLEAFLGIEPALYDDREALRAHVVAWQGRCLDQFWAEHAATPEEERPPASLLESGMHLPVYPATNMIVTLSWSLHRQKQSDRALSLFGADLGLWPDSLASLEGLSRKADELGVEKAFEVVGSWTNLVMWAGRLDELTATFQEEFAADAGPGGAFRPGHRWRTNDANAAALLFRALASRLMDDAPEAVVDLYRACAGVPDREVGELEDRRAPWLSHVDPAYADPLLAVIGISLFGTGRLDELVAMLETEFGVSDEDYLDQTGRLRRKLLGRWEGLGTRRIMPMVLFPFWSLGLAASHRVVEAAGLAFAFFPEFLDASADDYRRHFALLEELPSPCTEMAVYSIGRAIFKASLGVECIQLVDAYLGLEPADYRCGREGLARKLRSFVHRRPSQYLAMLVDLLGMALIWVERFRDAIALNEAALDIHESAYQDPKLPSARVLMMVRTLRAAYSLNLARAKLCVGDAKRAVDVLEALLGLATIRDYSGANWLATTGARVFPVEVEWTASGKTLEAVDLLLNALEAAGESEKRRALLEMLDSDHSWIEAPDVVEVLQGFMIAVELLGHLVDRDPDRCLEFCTGILRLLRAQINNGRLTSLDRLRLARLTTWYRRRVVAMGHTMAIRERDPERAEVLRRQFVCWDAELGQRVVLERYLYATPDSSADGPEEPFPGWALTGRCPRDIEPSANAAAPLGCFDRHDGPAPATVSHDSRALFPGPRDDRLAMLASLREGVDESRLAETLGDDQLLLRAGFTMSGQLAWSLFERDGGRLRTRCNGSSPDGLDARALIQAAVRRHDDAIHDGWERLRLGGKWDHLRFLIQLPLEGIASGDRQCVAAWADRLDARLGEFGLPSLRERLRGEFPGLLAAGPSGCPEIDAGRWRAFWAGVAAQKLDTRELEQMLDRATSTMLQEVATIWPLHELVAALDATPEVDLLFQGEDVLFGVPIAFLEHAGRPLFERVRSIRSVLSLAIQAWLGETDMDAFESALDEPDRLLSLSWFRNDDLAARRGAEVLHLGHRSLARSRQGEDGERHSRWYSAADWPPGTLACLARGLERHGAFRVVSVCGHGRSDLSGIELGDGIWNGSSLIQKRGEAWRSRDACDLLGIELLIQVSCSIGRVWQTGLEDVSGFCVELTVNRARSVLAGLWPLHSQQSPQFANRVAGHYLRLRADAVRDASADAHASCDGVSGADRVAARLAAARPRARAVAAARREWLARSREGTEAVGLNTAAAFELFGLG